MTVRAPKRSLLVSGKRKLRFTRKTSHGVAVHTVDPIFPGRTVCGIDASVVRDPGVEAGPFRVFARTDGTFVIGDMRRHFADRAVTPTSMDLKRAIALCHELAAKETA